MKGNKVRWYLFIVVLAVFMLACSPMPAPLQQETAPTPLDVIIQISLGFASLAGVASLVAVVIQVGKLFNVVKDDTAHKWSAGFNLLAFGVLVYFGVFQPSIALSVLDGYAAQVAQIGLFVLGFIVQITTSKPAYNAIKSARVPLLSYSFSA